MGLLQNPLFYLQKHLELLFSIILCSKCKMFVIIYIAIYISSLAFLGEAKTINHHMTIF